MAVLARFEHTCSPGGIYEFCGLFQHLPAQRQQPTNPLVRTCLHHKSSLNIKSEWEETLLLLSSNKDNKSQSNLAGQLPLILAMGTSPHLGYTVFFPGGSSSTSKDSYTSLIVMHD